MSESSPLFNTLSSYVPYGVNPGCPITVGFGHGDPRSGSARFRRPEEGRQGPGGGAEGEGLGEEEDRTKATPRGFAGAHARPYRLRLRVRVRLRVRL